MSRWKRQGSKRRSIYASLVALALLLVVSLPATALSKPTATKTNMPYGWGDEGNSFSWSMAWYNGKLYVGTGRYTSCFSSATYDFYDIAPYSTNPAPGVTCPPDWMDLDLRAEIWQYTPETNTWLRVYQSPTVPNPERPGKQIATDIAYRGMVIYHGQLYVLGVSADEIVPELQTTSPPRILRTSDGTHFSALNIAPYQILYPDSQNNGQLTKFYPMGYRAYAVFNDQLYVTAPRSLTGDGPLLRVNDPEGPNPTLTQITPGNMQVFELETFNNQIYLGGANKATGYFVARTDAVGDNPTYTMVVQNGAGRGASVNSVVSMHVYNDQLFVGASGWYAGTRASELIVVRADDSWDLVVGGARQTDQGLKEPISGFGDGFGNPFNVHFWRMEDSQGELYLGTNDASWLLARYPLANRLLSWQYGFDEYYSPDGFTWFQATHNAFDDSFYNFGVRTMIASPSTMYLGSANATQGTMVWQVDGPTTAATSNALSSVEADVINQGTAVTWDAALGAIRYHIYRADYVSNRAVNAVPAQRPVGDMNFVDAPFQPTQDIPGAPAPDIWLPAAFHEIATTTQTNYIDRSATPGGHYVYYVQVEYARGQLSQPSNLAPVPSQSPPVSFEGIGQQVRDVMSQGELSQYDGARVLNWLNQAQASAAKGNVLMAQASLRRAETIAGNRRAGATDDLVLNLQRLERQVRLSGLSQPGS
ncbi:MAG TPA: hypothetical protein VFI42_05410 [Thermomicrobiaceae bacterium]|nr:hypothetical protein [Thermomicrobiaceae bacterium]